MGDYENDRNTTSARYSVHWPLALAAALVLTTVYLALPPSDDGPSSVTVSGINTPQPSIGSYPGVRVMPL